MRFSVSRASAPWKAPDAPCEGATYVTESSFHGEYKQWSIEIADLDALLALAKNSGTLILSADHRIMIYDDYIE